MLQKAEQLLQLSSSNFPVLTSGRADTGIKTHDGHTVCVEYDLWDLLVFLHTDESPLSGGLAYPEIEQRPSTSHAWS